MSVSDDQALSRRKVLGGSASLALGATLAGLGSGQVRPAHAQSPAAISKQRGRSMDINRLPPGVIPEHYDLFIRPDPGFFDVSSEPVLRFEGSVSIKILVDQPTAEVTLNAAELQLRHAILDGDERATISLNEREQTATLVFDRPIAVGTHALSIDYSGKIYEGAQGLFVSQYKTAQDTRRLLVTQFEPGDARRFIPCWDEPARKATFTVAVAAPKDMLAVSNMPIEVVSELDEERVYVRFQKTPGMSSYLLFLAIGDLERVSMRSGATVVSLVAKTGSAQDGRFALESAVKLLEFYNEYFGVPFPLPKLDMIAAPGAGGFSAMENWGAILYFEDQLLLNPEWSTESNRQRVFVVVAHEMAHQWFGDLVTMHWWDDLWLNEGFASWMERKATDHFNKDWNNWLDAEFETQRAMRQDSMKATHPVVKRVLKVQEAGFDDITYRKGRAVIRMIENYIGEDAFREGIRAYMKRYAHQNTVTDNLWDELEAASNKKIKELAGDFINQPGVPLIAVESAAADGYKIRQKRFAVDANPNDTGEWTIPVYALSAGQVQNAPVLVQKGESNATAIPASPPRKLNAGQTVYYRVDYGSAFAELLNEFGTLKAPDQLGLLNDAWALGEADAAPIGNYLDLTLKLTTDTDPLVWRQLADTFVAIDLLYDSADPRRNSWRAYGRRMLNPALAAIKWDKQSGEPNNKSILRESLITALAYLDDSGVKKEARSRFDDYRAGKPLPALIKRPVFQAVCLGADTGLYTQVNDLAKKATDSFAQDQMFVALALAGEPLLAQESLKTALGKDPAKTTGPKMIQSVAVRNPDLAWQFALINLETINKLLDAEQRGRFIPSLTATSRSQQVLNELKDIRKKDPEISPSWFAKSVAELEFRLEVVQRLLPKIDDWLAKHP